MTKQHYQHLILNPKAGLDDIVSHKSIVYPTTNAHGYLSFRDNPNELDKIEQLIMIRRMLDM